MGVRGAVILLTPTVNYLYPIDIMRNNVEGISLISGACNLAV